MNDDPLHIIADPGRGEDELLDAIARLGPVMEPPAFWAALANSGAHSAVQRRHYVFQLFHRHVTPHMSLSTLAKLLDGPQWLRRGDVVVIEDLGGSIPVRMTDDDTVVRLGIAPGQGLPDHWAIYLRVAGKVGEDELFAMLRHQTGGAAVAAAEILELGFSPASVVGVAAARPPPP